MAGGRHVGIEKELVEEDESGTIGNSLSDKEMNLINLPLLTKRQRVHYFPKETLEQCQERKEMAKKLGIELMDRKNPCERYTNFGILCLSQDLP